jgi:TonB family protein
VEAVVSDILASRMREPEGLTKMAVVSLAAHVAAIALIVVAAEVWKAKPAAPKIVMHISLGGSPGPKTGGMEQIGGRSIVAAQPTSDPKIAKQQLPVLKEEPKMVLPDPRAKPKPPAKNTVASHDPRGTTAGRGAETVTGSAKIETGARGQGFGLSSGGGGGTDGSRLEVTDFCCPEYLVDMRDRIYRVWVQQQQASGVVLMKYTILRNGTLTDIQVERSSNNILLDRESQRALTLTRLAPLPAPFPDDHLIVHLEFRYERNR